ncbi:MULTISPECIES: response regulator [Microbacterium]|uniref:Response regulator transcription factor n=1 Tax=Microbacterium aquilitoris TaxID=3067307 RepID=A0ABU3GG68_9MICO|nr:MULTISPECIES: response regulator transcription factor [unclassified Microbacterium]MDT3329681.1 response regulator transcription factor [Microbacterium sp. KSW-18]MDT3345516.1 response regulator transcription factor [Microbacterium sp. KSW2-22]SDH21694.1 DNA-binding response regulator, NarL/FixJ family, contains REC and HTH domains [Microbacterium sp. 77mftsu3.1]
MDPIRVLIADDEALVRRALQVFLNAEPGMTVVGEASDGPSAVRLSLELKPDVILMDIRMPGGDGIRAIEQLSVDLPSARTIAITTYGSDETVAGALRVGAVGFLVKDSEPEHITAAVRSAHHGGFVLSSVAGRDLVRRIGAQAGQPTVTLSPAEQVSRRELDVLELLAKGMSNAEIGRDLFLSEATVKSHLRRIMTKWGVRDRVQVLLYAATTGVIRLP